MTRIGLISDTHGFIDPLIFKYFEPCDEIWHAGDIGTMYILQELENFKKTRAVYGNIDGHQLREALPLDLFFEIEGVKVWMTHIGGYPPKYNKRIREKLIEVEGQDVFVCGHSHILKVLRDPHLEMLCLNPGAAGNYGLHKVKTLLRFSVHQGRLKDMEVIELGKRI